MLGRVIHEYTSLIWTFQLLLWENFLFYKNLICVTDFWSTLTAKTVHRLLSHPAKATLPYFSTTANKNHSSQPNSQRSHNFHLSQCSKPWKGCFWILNSHWLWSSPIPSPPSTAVTNQITSNLHIMNTIFFHLSFQQPYVPIQPTWKCRQNIPAKCQNKTPYTVLQPKMKSSDEGTKGASLWNINCRREFPDFVAMTLAWTVQDIGFWSAKPDTLWFIHFNKRQQLVSTGCIIPISDENCFQIQNRKGHKTASRIKHDLHTASTSKVLHDAVLFQNNVFKKNKTQASSIDDSTVILTW